MTAREGAEPGRRLHYDPSRGDFRQWFDALTEAQQTQLRDKARWEHMTLTAVAREWGVDA